MNANETIDAYVTEVALRLPRRQRNDVAFELRALLEEELQAKAESTGREIDAGMATELLNAFGHPADVAARYRPSLTIIDPADGQSFMRLAIIGLGVIWAVGLLTQVVHPLGSGGDVLSASGQWWTGTVIPSLWWPGVLVVWFATASWTRRRWPRTTAWKPRAVDRIHGGRGTLAAGIFAIACGVFLLANPHWLLDAVWDGRAAPAAYEALTYTDAFRQRQAPWLFGLLLLNIPILVTVLVQDRWSVPIKRMQTLLGLATAAVMAWVVIDGPVFMAPVSDRFFKLALVAAIALTLVDLGVQRYRRIRPTPG